MTILSTVDHRDSPALTIRPILTLSDSVDHPRPTREKHNQPNSDKQKNDNFYPQNGRRVKSTDIMTILSTMDHGVSPALTVGPIITLRDHVGHPRPNREENN